MRVDDKRLASAERWTEQWRAGANRVFQGLTAVLQLLAQTRRRNKDQVRMAVRVVANGVTSSLNGASNGGPVADVLANQKKCNLSLTRSKNVQPARSDG